MVAMLSFLDGAFVLRSFPR